ncbi:hypothetical protein CK203_001716 [Vitis vinifera]|uniref:OTU domain-containing protein n=1 Tax=Vitis vinifera TaxID=29760 RepID=A0A438KIP0_VITVI|nr:hypothetical protein CK203_001716 [Vitis vinifera]
MVQAKHQQKSKAKKQPQMKKQGKQADISEFRAQLDALGLKIIQVTADGNCFFRALADQLEGNEEGHEKYRSMVVRYILPLRVLSWLGLMSGCGVDAHGPRFDSCCWLNAPITQCCLWWAWLAFRDVFFEACLRLMHKKNASMKPQRQPLENRDMFEPFIEDDVPFDDYCQSMEKDGTWAGHMELQAASLVTRSNICIHRVEMVFYCGSIRRRRTPKENGCTCSSF